MENSTRRRPVEIRFSPLSLFCLFFVWLGVSALAFYVGMLVGRTEQMREIRKVYRADESAVADEEAPLLSFEESLTASKEQEDVGSASVAPKKGPAEPSPGSKEIARGGSTVLQIGSFRKPEFAEQLVRTLAKKGYPAFRVGSGADGGYCKVFVGPLSSKETAAELKEHLEQQEGYRGILIRSVGEKEGPP
jgi:cell division septation protein DedD